MAICRSSPRWDALVNHLIHEKDGNDVFETVGAGGLKLFKQCWMFGGTISQSTYGTHRWVHVMARTTAGSATVTGGAVSLINRISNTWIYYTIVIGAPWAHISTGDSLKRYHGYIINIYIYIYINTRLETVLLLLSHKIPCIPIVTPLISNQSKPTAPQSTFACPTLQICLQHCWGSNTTGNN